jgi:arsenate reductase
LHALLTERGVDFRSIDYHATGISESELRELLHKMRCSPREILWVREPLVEELRLEEAGVSDDELIAQMSANPVLLQRPIAVYGDRALLARPIERVFELIR